MPRRLAAHVVRYWLRLVRAHLLLGLRFRYIVATTKLIFAHLDPATIRVLLAFASVLWAIGALPWMPFFYSHPFGRHGYEVMSMMASEEVWAWLFLLHAAGVTWRFYERTERPNWNNAVNFFGFVLWGTTTGCINYSIGAYTNGTSMELALTCASAWALLKTGKVREVVTL
jgi:hypothetical protein